VSFGEGEEGTVVFRETDESIDIYLASLAAAGPTISDPPISNTAIVELSEHFVKYCRISNSEYRVHVFPILTLPLDKIGPYLEVHNLRTAVDATGTRRFVETLNHGTLDFSQTVSRAPGAVAIDELQISSGRSTLTVPEDSALTDGIPALGEYIASIRAAAVATATVTSHNTAMFSMSVSRDGYEVDQPVEHSNGRARFRDSGVENSPRRGSSPQIFNPGGSEAVFAFDNLNTALSEIAGVNPRPRRPRNSMPYATAREQGHNGVNNGESLRNKLIGFLGEHFVRKPFIQVLEVLS